MQSSNGWKEKITQELVSASEGRNNGNEGLARVCSRRAVGWAIQAYYQNNGLDLQTTSALECIKFMYSDQETPRKTKKVLGYFLQRVVKDSTDGESYWPVDVDLIIESRWLIKQLLNLNIELPPNHTG